MDAPGVKSGSWSEMRRCRGDDYGSSGVGMAVEGGRYIWEARGLGKELWGRRTTEMKGGRRVGNGWLEPVYSQASIR